MVSRIEKLMIRITDERITVARMRDRRIRRMRTI